MAFGSFSLVHPGHAMYLEEARKLGDHLTVVLTTDKNIEKEKGRKPVFSEEERVKLVSSLKMVDRTIIGHDSDFFKIVELEKPDVIAIGYDAKCTPAELRKQLAGRGINVEVVQIKKFTGHKTREIIERIKNS